MKGGQVTRVIPANLAIGCAREHAGNGGGDVLGFQRRQTTCTATATKHDGRISGVDVKRQRRTDVEFHFLFTCFLVRVCVCVWAGGGRGEGEGGFGAKAPDAVSLIKDVKLD